MDNDIGIDTPLLPRVRGLDKQLKAALEMKSTAPHDESPILTDQELENVPAATSMHEYYSFG